MKRNRPRPQSSLRVYRSYNGGTATKPTKNRPLRDQPSSPVKLPIPSLNLRRIALVICGIILLWVSYIQTITVNGEPKPDEAIASSVTDATNRYLNARPWRHFQLFISSRELAQAISSQVPLISSIDVERSLFSHSVTILVKPKRAVAFWEQGRGAQRYVVDEEGRAFMKASGPEKLGLIISNEPINGAVQGKIVVDALTVKAAQDWVAELQKSGLTMDALTVGNTPREAEITLKDNPLHIRVATDVKASEAAKGLAASLQKIKDKSDQVHEYIDVRIPYRVFYK